MAIVTLPVQEIVKAGLKPSHTTIQSTDTYRFPNDDRTFVHLDNAGGGSGAIIFQTQRPLVTQHHYDGVDLENLTITFQAEDEKLIAVPPAQFNDITGHTKFTADSGVQCAVIRRPRD